jgi:hypothetical protein
VRLQAAVVSRYAVVARAGGRAWLVWPYVGGERGVAQERTVCASVAVATRQVAGTLARGQLDTGYEEPARGWQQSGAVCAVWRGSSPRQHGGDIALVLCLGCPW